jgi:hypothetical protein
MCRSARRMFQLHAVGRNVDMIRRSCLLATLALFVAIPGLMASSYTIVSQAGEGLPSIFYGLRPSPQAPANNIQPRAWKGISTNHLPGVVGNFIGGGCFGSLCSGSFTVIVPDPGGGCVGEVCPVNDFIVDPQNGECHIGEQDLPCSDGVVCCASAFQCNNPRVVGC